MASTESANMEFDLAVSGSMVEMLVRNFSRELCALAAQKCELELQLGTAECTKKYLRERVEKADKVVLTALAQVIADFNADDSVDSLGCLVEMIEKKLGPLPEVKNG